MTTATKRLPLPQIGSVERDEHEAAALKRALELLHDREGHLRDALYALGEELKITLRLQADERGYGPRDAADWARDFQYALVDHVEQCWASAIVRGAR